MCAKMFQLNRALHTLLELGAPWCEKDQYVGGPSSRPGVSFFPDWNYFGAFKMLIDSHTRLLRFQTYKYHWDPHAEKMIEENCRVKSILPVLQLPQVLDPCWFGVNSWAPLANCVV